MRIALIAPHVAEQNGIADYAHFFSQALVAGGIEVEIPWTSEISAAKLDLLEPYLKSVDWSRYDAVHAELGGGRNREFLTLQWLSTHYPDMPLTATVHDPERLIWRPVELPIFLAWAELLPKKLYQLAVLLADPYTLATERQLAAKLSRIVTLTEIGRQFLTRRMRLGAEKVIVIPHGNQDIKPTPLPKLPPDGPLKLLYFGFIYRGKGIEDLIKALQLIIVRHPDLKSKLSLTLAGGTKPGMAFGQDGSYLDDLRIKLKQLDLDIDVQWFLDVPSQAIPSLIQSHHVMVLPYRESKKLAFLGQMLGTSGALSWAAACGRSVISSDARAFAEEVSKGNGEVFKQGDIKALASAIEAMIQEPALISHRAACAAELGQGRRWMNTVGKFKALFESVIGEPKHG